MTDKEFDKILKQKMEGLPSGDVVGWQELNQRIEKELNLDQLVKEKMTNLKLNEVQGWEALNAKIDQEIGKDTTSAEDSNFDQQILSKLGGQQTPYSSDSWDLLENKLDENEGLRKRLLLAGFLQFLAALLILLSLWNWKGAEYIHERNIKHQAESEIEYAFAQMKETFYEQFILDLNERNTLLSSISIVSELPASIKSIPSFEQNIATTQNSGIVTNTEEVEEVKLAAYRNVDDAILWESNNAKPRTADKSTSNSAAPREAYKLLDQLSSSEDISLLGLERQIPHKNPLIQFVQQKKKEIKTNVGIAFSPDIYLIRSPDDPIYPSPSYFTDSFGKSGGFTFSARHKGFEVETGLLYSTVSYRPREINETYSSQGRFYETSLQNIFFNVVTLPLQIKNHINIGKKSSFFFHAGASFNTIINSNFNIKNTAIAAPLNPLADNSINQPLLELKDFEPGVLEGGNIFDNAFATVDVGIGFQQMVVKDLFFYVQPSISTQFTTGIGPNEDKLHKLSLNIGAKYQLN